jgi:hypothetical protein
MKPELLVAWIETEGWFRIRIDPSDHYIGVSVAISQSNFETLEKIRKEVGFGRTDFSRGEGKLCFDRQEDIPKIISKIIKSGKMFGIFWVKEEIKEPGNSGQKMSWNLF